MSEDKNFSVALNYLLKLKGHGSAKILCKKFNTTSNYISYLRRGGSASRARKEEIAACFGLQLGTFYMLGEAIAAQNDLAIAVIEKMVAAPDMNKNPPDWHVILLGDSGLAGTLVGFGWTRDDGQIELKFNDDFSLELDSKILLVPVKLRISGGPYGSGRVR
jgi:hypothetical protein